MTLHWTKSWSVTCDWGTDPWCEDEAEVHVGDQMLDGTLVRTQKDAVMALRERQWRMGRKHVCINCLLNEGAATNAEDEERP